MTPSQWNNVKQLFRDACERPAEQHEDFLRDCGADVEIRNEVQRLLALDRDASMSFLESPLAASEDADARSSDTDPLIGAQVGQFTLCERIGAGGMGAVYAAQQQNPRRIVAIKIIRPGCTTPATLRRFSQEAALLGRLQHPAIARVLEAGTFDLGEGAQPYIAMEHIKGLPLLEYVAQKQLTIPQILILLIRIGDGVNHAHQKGVIHRDLKPTNILIVHREEDASDTSGSITTTGVGQPRILDFGVARATDPQPQMTTMTTAGELVGTLRYMSPEQLRGNPQHIDTRSDVYALGVIGYQMLTGVMPLEIADRSVAASIRAIEENDPAPLSSHHRELRGDLDTIFARALEKDPDHRYQSAADFAADLARYLNNQPIVARPPTTLYQLRKFAARHRGLVAGVMIAFVILLAGMMTTGWQAMRAIRHAAAADHEARRAVAVTDFLKRIFSFADPLSGGASVNLRDLVDNAEQEIPHLFKDMPLGEADVRNEVGTIYLALGAHDSARAQFARAMQLWNDHHGPDHPQTLKAVNNLGQVATTLGDSQSALPLLARAHDGRLAALGPDHEATIRSQINLAMAHAARGNMQLAEQLIRDAAERQQDTHGRHTVDSITTLANLAMLRRDQDDLNGAFEIGADALAAARETLGDEHARTLVTMSMHALTLKKMERYDQARALYAAAVGGLESKFGPHHHDVLMARMNYAQLLLREQDYPAAAAQFIAAADAWNDRYSGSHRYEFHASRGAARALQELGDLPQAERRWRQTLAGYERHYGETDRRTLEAIDDLADVIDRQDRRAETLDLRLRRRAHAPATYGPGALRTVRSIRDVARVYIALDRTEDARAELQAAIDLSRESLGEDHEETRRLLDMRAALDASPDP